MALESIYILGIPFRHFDFFKPQSLWNEELPLKIFEKASQDWEDNSIPEWPALRELERSNLEELDLLQSWLREQAQISKKKQLFNHRKIFWLIILIQIRKLLYTLSLVILYLTIPISALMLTVFWPDRNDPLNFTSYPSIPFWALGAVAFCIVLKLWLGGYRSSKTIRDYLSDDLSDEEKNRLVQIYDDIRKGNYQSIIKTNNASFRTISDLCSSAENSFLFLTGKPVSRYGIVLLGRPPKGTLFYKKKITTRDTRDPSSQIKYLSTTAKLKRTYDKICTAMDNDRLSGKLLLNQNRQVRLEAMKFGLDNPKLWNSSDKERYLSENPETKAALLKIFRPIAKTKSTLEEKEKDLGTDLMLSFIRFKDRTCGNWLNELEEANVI